MVSCWSESLNDHSGDDSYQTKSWDRFQEGVWDPNDPELEVPVGTVDLNIYIGNHSSTNKLATFDQLTAYLIQALDWYADNGLLQWRATPFADNNGMTLKSMFYV